MYKLTWTKTQETCPSIFPHLWQLSHIWIFFFFIGATLWPYCVRTNEMRKRAKLSFILVYAPDAVFQKNVTFIKIYCKMTCCLLVGNKAVDWNFRKKLFVVSLLAHLILMNMFRLNALIFQNWRLLVFGVNIRASQSLSKELQSVSPL